MSSMALKANEETEAQVTCPVGAWLEAPRSSPPHDAAHPGVSAITRLPRRPRRVPSLPTPHLSALISEKHRESRQVPAELISSPAAASWSPGQVGEQ